MRPLQQHASLYAKAGAVQHQTCTKPSKPWTPDWHENTRTSDVEAWGLAAACKCFVRRTSDVSGLTSPKQFFVSVPYPNAVKFSLL